MKTPGFDKKRRTLEWNFKNTEILKKHGIFITWSLKMAGVFEKAVVFEKVGVFEKDEVFGRTGF